MIDPDMQLARDQGGGNRRVVICPRCTGNVRLGTPEQRQDQIVIELFCQYCYRSSELVIMQENGQALIDWR